MMKYFHHLIFILALSFIWSAAFAQCVTIGAGTVTANSRTNTLEQAKFQYFENDSALIYFIIEQSIDTVYPLQSYKLIDVKFTGPDSIPSNPNKVYVTIIVDYLIQMCASVNFNPTLDSTNCFQHEFLGWTCPDKPPINLDSDFINLCYVQTFDKTCAYECGTLGFIEDKCSWGLIYRADGTRQYFDCVDLVYECLFEVEAPYYDVDIPVFKINEN